jgi:twitching motility protein PilT
MPFDIDDCLRYVIEHEGSDLHLKANAPPMARIRGSLRPIDGMGGLKPADTESALETLIAGEDTKREEFDADGEADFSYEIKDLSRFRVNAFRQRNTVSIVCRAIPFQVRTVEDLGLPPVIRKLADEPRGIILLTGTTGSGKSSTLAAMIDHINTNYPHHIITLEDPIEYLHRDKRSIINQREVGSDTHSFGRAMRRILRQDPDVILIGEMRDEETVRTALSAAETGHLVLSTLHTLDATETINRIIDFFPPHLQQQARVMLAATLRGAVSQRLVPTADGKGRVAAAEVMVVTGRIQDLILNPNETGKISQVIAEGEYYGMQTFDQSLLHHVGAGHVTVKTAMDYASSPHDFKLMLASAGKKASDFGQMLEDEAEPVQDLLTDDRPAMTPTPEEEPAQPDPVPVVHSDLTADSVDPEDLGLLTDDEAPSHTPPRRAQVQRPPGNPGNAGPGGRGTPAEDPAAEQEEPADRPAASEEGSEPGPPANGLGHTDYAEIWNR